MEWEREVRGYNRQQVDNYVAWRVGQVRELESRLSQSLARSRTCARELADARASRRPPAARGDQRAGRPDTQAGRRGGQGRARARRVRRQQDARERQGRGRQAAGEAKQEADRIKTEAQERAERMLTAAQEQADRAVAAATAEAEQMISSARASRRADGQRGERARRDDRQHSAGPGQAGAGRGDRASDRDPRRRRAAAEPADLAAHRDGAGGSPRSGTWSRGWCQARSPAVRWRTRSTGRSDCSSRRTALRPPGRHADGRNGQPETAIARTAARSASAHGGRGPPRCAPGARRRNFSLSRWSRLAAPDVRERPRRDRATR